MRTILNAGLLHSADTVGCAVRLVCCFVFIAIGLGLASCEAHDYWLLTEPIEVDSRAGIYAAHSKDEIAQDLFVRYELNYEVENVSTSQETELVVSATSYVNNVERSTGQKVWLLDVGEKSAGVLPPESLSYGNSLRVSLFCCSTSRCEPRKVSCSHLEKDTQYDEAIISFCYKSCNTPEVCIDKCPSESACSQICKDAESVETCRRASCKSDAGLANCEQTCGDDKNCLESCTAVPECVDGCYSQVAGCFRNCLSTAYLCTDNAYLSDVKWIPCALCGGTGLCACDFRVQDTRKLTSSTGIEYTCDLDCSTYPSACVTGCDKLYDKDSDRENCLNQCLTQYLFWCNDNQISVDYIDSSIEQPCCYSDFCQGRLTGVVKSYDVECFNDTNCGSDKYCTDQGVCEIAENSGCAAMPNAAAKKNPYRLPFLYLFVILIIGRCVYRKRRSQNMGRGA